MNSKPIILTVAGLFALGIGVYVMFAGSGNTTLPAIAGNVNIGSGATCEASVERGKSVDSIAVGDVAAFRPLEAPLDLTYISFVDGDGNAKSLADWRGKTVLFNLWATWCPPCREEMPWFEALQLEKGGDSFQVVPVSIDLGDAAKPKQFYEETGLKALPFLHDNTMEAFQSLRKKAVALGMPTTLLVDRNGCGMGVLNGPAHWNSPDAHKLIDAVLALPELS
ncbi:MAG: TlpA disulfide reductase family protein [Pseudomonadota bacterium]